MCVKIGKSQVQCYFAAYKGFVSGRSLSETHNREEKWLCHVAIVAKFLDDNKPIKSLKSLFALFQTLPILFNFI